MKFLVKYVGGSQLYGLDTPESDVDYRGVYMHEDPAKILRFAVEDNLCHTQEKGDDYAYYELHRYFQLLRKTNTQSVEALFIREDYPLEHTSSQFEAMKEKRFELLDSRQLLNSTKGYVMSETRLALGERAGRMGGKRREKLDQFGFSPKNVAQIVRIVAACEHFMKERWYPLNLKKEGLLKDHELSYEVKNHPENFSLDDVKKVCSDCEKRIQKVEDKQNLQFNEKVAVEFMRRFYLPFLTR